MTDAIRALRPWVVFAGSVLLVAVLYWAQRLLVPIAVSMLVTFMLTPVVTLLQPRIGRLTSVLVTVVLAFSLLGVAGWGLARQVAGVARDLPAYRENIRHRIEELRTFGQGGAIEQLQDTVKDITREIERKDEPTTGTARDPLVVTPQQVTSLWSLPTALGPLFEPLATAALVMVMVVFMLLERQDLRNRLIGLLGHGRLTLTTKALDEAATRISRYLLTQSLVNIGFGVGVGLGLLVLGVPYPLLWAALAACLRFIPYIGAWAGAAAPLLVSLATLEGWLRPLLVLTLFVALELVVGWVLEPLLYAGAAGVSQVGLLAAIAFWTWLWGPPGLLMATPLTVCLVVIGKHFPGMETIATLMSEAPPLAEDVTFYQRLLAQDQHEASDLIDEYLRAHGHERVYDALLVPALSSARRDHADERLSGDDQRAIHQILRDLLLESSLGPPATKADDDADGQTHRLRVLGCAASGEADELALTMFQQLLRETPFSVDIASAHRLASETTSLAREGRFQVACIADVPPGSSSRARYLVKRLRTAMPELKIIVGRWGGPLTEDERTSFVAAGADYVAGSLVESRDQLYQLVTSMPKEHRSALAPDALATDPDRVVGGGAPDEPAGPTGRRRSRSLPPVQTR